MLDQTSFENLPDGCQAGCCCPGRVFLINIIKVILWLGHGKLLEHLNQVANQSIANLTDFQLELPNHLFQCLQQILVIQFVHNFDIDP